MIQDSTACACAERLPALDGLDEAAMQSCVNVLTMDEIPVQAMTGETCTRSSLVSGLSASRRRHEIRLQLMVTLL